MNVAAFALLFVLAAACTGNVTVVGTGESPLNVCACWAARQREVNANPAGSGPCLSCWVKTIGVQGNENGRCHYDQARCLADPGCTSISTKAQQCGADPACQDAAISSGQPQASRDMFLDWSRCFCHACFDACDARSTAVACKSDQVP